MEHAYDKPIVQREPSALNKVTIGNNDNSNRGETTVNRPWQKMEIVSDA